MSIDEAIIELQEIRERSPLKGETCLVLCLVDSGLPYMNIDEIKVEYSKDGAIARLDVNEPPEVE